MAAPGANRAAHTPSALRAAGLPGRTGGHRGRALPEGATRRLDLGEQAAEQQSDSSWSFPVRCVSHARPHLCARLVLYISEQDCCGHRMPPVQRWR